MKKIFANPTMEVKKFAVESIVTASEVQTTADTSVTETNASVKLDFSTISFID